MKVRPNTWMLAFLLLAGCPAKETTAEGEDSAKASDSSKPATNNNSTTTGGGPAPTAPATTAGGTTTTPGTTTTTPAPTGTDTGAATATPAPAGIQPRVKAEIDNKPDGLTTGAPMPVSNAKALIQVPKEWAKTPGDTQVAKSADDKARIAVHNFGPDGPNALIAPTAQAAGLTNCQWAAPETVTAGKDKLTASVADGVCTRGTIQAKAAMMAVDGLLVIGSWDEGGDQASVFNSFRSVTKVTGVDPLIACCQALAQNAKSAPPQQVPFYLAAAAACNSARSNPNTAAALATIRASLRGANMPSSCR